MCDIWNEQGACRMVDVYDGCLKCKEYKQAVYLSLSTPVD